MKLFRSVVFILVLFISSMPFGCSSKKQVGVLKSVESADGVWISYELYAGKEPTLIFIHGWSCDGGYWREQVPFFSKRYQVATIDLAGHGRSGLERKKYSIDSFADDVKAVVDSIGSNEVVLIGHSSGGSVAMKAASLLPRKVIGVVAVDSIQDVAYPLTEEEFTMMVDPFRKDFKGAVKAFLKDMFVESTPPELVAWITEDMSSAPPRVAVSAMEEYLGDFLNKRARGYLAGLSTPVYSIDSKLYPTNVASNKKYIRNYDVTYIDEAGHFLMLEKPALFNETLDRIVKKWSKSCDSAH